MNRRTFLKATGITALTAIAGPLMAKPKSKSQWINFVDKMPKTGQKVALFTYFDENRSSNICTGEVIDKNNHWIAKSYSEDTICIKGVVSYSPNGHFSDSDILIFTGANLSRGEATRKVARASWLEKKIINPFHCDGMMIVPRHGRKKTEYIGRSAAYWTPIKDYIPEVLPIFPEPKTLTFIYEHGKKMILK